jgi:ribosomal protein S27AE
MEASSADREHVRKLSCGVCRLVYEELVNVYTNARASLIVGSCPRCGAHDVQTQLSGPSEGQ